MSDAMLTAGNLSAWYGAARILFDLSFEVGRGEVVTLMGRNGAGKSTTMKTIMGLIARRQGSVRDADRRRDAAGNGTPQRGRLHRA